MSIELTAIVAGTVAAATPLIFAGLGELVAERTGVINLGVEGMMLVGAIAGFAFASQYEASVASAFYGRIGRHIDGTDFCIFHLVFKH